MVLADSQLLRSGSSAFFSVSVLPRACAVAPVAGELRSPSLDSMAPACPSRGVRRGEAWGDGARLGSRKD